MSIIVRKPQSKYRYAAKKDENSNKNNAVDDIDDRLHYNAERSTRSIQHRQSISTMDLIQPKHYPNSTTNRHGNLSRSSNDFDTFPSGHSTSTQSSRASASKINSSKVNSRSRPGNSKTQLINTRIRVVPKDKTNMSNGTDETHPTKNSTVSSANSLHITRIDSGEESVDGTDKKNHGPSKFLRDQPISRSKTQKKERKSMKKREVEQKLKSNESTSFTSRSSEKPRPKHSGLDLKSTELNDINRAVEELLIENDRLKRRIRKKKKKKILSSPKNISNQTFSKEYVHQSPSLRQSKDGFKNEHRKHSRIKAEIEEKQQRYRILLLAESGTNKKVVGFDDSSYMDLFLIEKEKKLLSSEIESLQRELSDLSYVSNRSKSDHFPAPPSIDQHTYVVKTLMGENEQLQGKNNYMRRQLQVLTENLKLKDGLIKSLRMQLTRHGSQYKVTEKYFGPFEEELNAIDELWLETQKDLANVQKQIRSNRKHQEKCKSEKDFETLESVLESERKFKKIETDLQAVIADMKEEKKRIYDQISSNN